MTSGMWTVEDLKKLAGLNFLRIFREVEKVSDDEGVFLCTTRRVFLLFFALQVSARKRSEEEFPIEELISKDDVREYSGCRSVNKRDAKANDTLC